MRLVISLYEPVFFSTLHNNYQWGYICYRTYITQGKSEPIDTYAGNLPVQSTHILSANCLTNLHLSEIDDVTHKMICYYKFSQTAMLQYLHS